MSTFHARRRSCPRGRARTPAASGPDGHEAGRCADILASPPAHPATHGSILGHEFIGRISDAGGANVVVCDVSDARLEVLRNAGISTINASREPLADALRAVAPDGADVVVDCVGTQLDAALDVVRTGGRISLFGMNSHARPAVRQNTITRNELTIYGSYVGVNTFPRAIAILERAVITPSVLISAIMPLDRTHEALDLLRSGSAMKIAIRH